MTKFSIIVPTHNLEPYIKECIQSVLAQDFEDFEIIIIDDASTDATAQMAQQFSDPRVRVISMPINQGPSACRNVGISAAIGEYLMLLDGDDVFLSGRLRAFDHAIRHHDPDVLLDDVLMIREKGGGALNSIYWRAGVVVNRPESISLERFIQYDFGILKGAIRRSAVLQAGVQFREEIRLAEDFLFYLDAYIKGFQFMLLPSCYYGYRIRAGSLIRTVEERTFHKLIASTRAALDLIPPGETFHKVRGLIRKRLRKQKANLNEFLWIKSIKAHQWMRFLELGLSDPLLPIRLIFRKLKRFLN